VMLEALKIFVVLAACSFPVVSSWWDTPGSEYNRAPDGVPEELLVPLEHGGFVGLSTRGPAAFRIRLVST
ncbi:unnamed protein product, partial [Polarella glacialis]